MTTIEIHAVRVDGRKLTLAAYRQVVTARPIAEDGSFAGEPVGTVNRHEDCDPRTDHRHVLWIHDGDLRVGTVYAPERARFTCAAAAEYAEALRIHDPKVLTFVGHSLWTFHLDGVQFRITLSREADRWPSDKRLVDTDEKLTAWLDHQNRQSLDDLAAAVPAEAYKHRWDDVLVLPQLFIGA